MPAVGAALANGDSFVVSERRLSYLVRKDQRGISMVECLVKIVAALLVCNGNHDRTDLPRAEGGGEKRDLVLSVSTRSPAPIAKP